MDEPPRARLHRLVLGMTVAVVTLSLSGCPTRGSIQPPMYGEDATTDDTGVNPGIDVPPGNDLGNQDLPPGIDALDSSVDGMVVPTDGEDVEDVPPVDAGPPRPMCPITTTAGPTDPCPTMASCGMPSHGTVTISGATTTYTDLQVQVTLPMSMLASIGTTCSQLIFRTAAGVWAPHHVTNCAMGMLWVRVPMLTSGTNTLQMYYGGSSSAATGDSYDDTFDRVPMHAAGTLGAWSFDEGTGSRSCPSVGTEPFDAHIHYTLYDNDVGVDLGSLPTIWSDDAPPSLLDPNAHFTRHQHSLNLPQETDVLPATGLPSPNRLVNWQTPGPMPFNTATMQVSVGIWAKPETTADYFGDNFQTVVCYGMPDLATRSAFWGLPPDDYHIINNSIFNPWAIFFRGDDTDNTFYQGNSCVHPCTDVIQYAHITTRDPLPDDSMSPTPTFVHQWHFLALTIDVTHTPHTLRQNYYDDHTYTYPADLDLFPPGGIYCPAAPPLNPDPLYFPCNRPYLADGGVDNSTPACWTACQQLCPAMDDGGIGGCINPPDAPIEYAPAPVLISADMNDGEPQLGFNGEIDDLFIIGRAITPPEMQAYRERRQYTADPIVSSVAP